MSKIHIKKPAYAGFFVEVDMIVNFYFSEKASESAGFSPSSLIKIAIKMTMKPRKIVGVITSARKITPKIAAKILSREIISEA